MTSAEKYHLTLLTNKEFENLASCAIDINDNGEIVGWVTIDTYLPHWPSQNGYLEGTMRSFKWNKSTKLQFITPSNFESNIPFSINANGHVIGWTLKSPWILQNTGFKFLNKLNVRKILNDGEVVEGSNSFIITDKNEKKQFVGRSDSNSQSLATLNNAKIMTMPSISLSINNFNQIVGAYRDILSTHTDLSMDFYLPSSDKFPNTYYHRFSNCGTRAFLWEQNTWIDIGTLGGDTIPCKINDLSQVVGWSSTRNIDSQPHPNGKSYPEIKKEIIHAFLWEKGQMKDLNNLIINNTSNFELKIAMSINNAGQIVGIGLLNGRAQAFLLDPLN